MNRYLITGGAGFIGRAITQRLIEQGNFVRVFDNESRGSKNSIVLSKNIEFLHGDIRDPKKVTDACKDINTIIHLAFVNGTRFFYEKPNVVLEVGVKGMLNVLEGARIHKVKELFLASSSEVYQSPPLIPTPENIPLVIPDPQNPRYSYAAGKIVSELMSLHMGTKICKKVVIFRPHNVYGPNMGHEHVIPELITKIIDLKNLSRKSIRLTIQGDGNQSRAFIYIDDFIDGLSILLGKARDREIYNIGTTDEITIKKLISFLEKISKTKITIQQNLLPEGSTKRRCPDITKIKSLGFSPKIDIRLGLLKTYLWYQTNSISVA